MNDLEYVSNLDPDSWEWCGDGEHFEFGEKEIWMTTTYKGVEYVCSAYQDCVGEITIDETTIEIEFEPESKTRIDILKCSVWVIILGVSFLIWKTITILIIKKIGDYNV